MTRLLLILLSLLPAVRAWAPPDMNSSGPTVSSGPGTVPEPMPPDRAEAQLREHAARIDVREIRKIATQNNGRVKPFDTLARETLLFASGSYSRWGLSAAQVYLAFIIDEAGPFVPIIEVRSLPLRERLGALRTQRFFSLAELEASPLMQMAEPVFQKNQENSKSLNEDEKKILECFHQFQLLRSVRSGDQFLENIDFSFLRGHGQNGTPVNQQIQEAAKRYLQALANDQQEVALTEAAALVDFTRHQETPELFQHYMDKLDLEIFYNDYRLFMWACVAALTLGATLLAPPLARRLSDRGVLAAYIVPLGLLASALGIRVYITGFAPVTNMYTTMIWVAQGVLLFSVVLFLLYRNRAVSGLALISSGLILLLTEKTPLILSPDMDPIVAVLRSNYWLSTHVTTITISYAAFTMAMILGNTALIRVFTHHHDQSFFREYAHYAYRMIQLGCFLLTCGIILGGIWADYSWGRFWGWDPKETWALIADLGFLAILHARYAGWLKDFSLLAACPVAYLLVIMAWYGVNFVLAAGLHSYGFSSGGTMMIVSFLALQLGLLAAAFGKLKLSGRRAH